MGIFRKLKSLSRLLKIAGLEEESEKVSLLSPDKMKTLEQYIDASERKEKLKELYKSSPEMAQALVDTLKLEDPDIDEEEIRGEVAPRRSLRTQRQRHGDFWRLFNTHGWSQEKLSEETSNRPNLSKYLDDDPVDAMRSVFIEFLNIPSAVQIEITHVKFRQYAYGEVAIARGNLSYKDKEIGFNFKLYGSGGASYFGGQLFSRSEDGEWRYGDDLRKGHNVISFKIGSDNWYRRVDVKDKVEIEQGRIKNFDIIDWILNFDKNYNDYKSNLNEKELSRHKYYVGQEFTADDKVKLPKVPKSGWEEHWTSWDR